MRWERDEAFVELTLGPFDELGLCWFIDLSPSLNWADLPIEFRGRYKEADNKGYEKLKTAASSWATRNGFASV